MHHLLRSFLVWTATVAIFCLWLFLLTFVFLTDRQPSRRRTARLLRGLGRTVARLNRATPALIVDLHLVQRERQYVVVSNHQSLADVPLLSHLPLDAKWLAKAGLFRTPVVGWMMRLAGDIPVNRWSVMGRALALRRALRVVQQGSSVVVFPEGTRSRDGRLYAFSNGPFYLAIKTGTPILPVALEGCDQVLPRGGWAVGSVQAIRARVLPPVPTDGLTLEDVPRLREQVRRAILSQLAAWREVPAYQVDGLHQVASDQGEWRMEGAEIGLLPGLAEPLGRA